jgi:hypothetical protein
MPELVTPTTTTTTAPAPTAVLGTGQLVYLVLVSLIVSALLVSNVIGVKLFSLSLSLGPLGTIPVTHTAGMLVFPVTFLVTDLINEYFGPRAARLGVYVAFAMGAIAWIAYALARSLPILEGIPGTATHAAFENIFGASALMYIASLIAFLANSVLDVHLFRVFKRWTGGRLVWLRATGSTVVSQLFDSFVITFVFFVVLQGLFGEDGPADLGFVLRTALTGYILKFVLAVALTPAIYAGRWAVARFFGLSPIPPEQA